jgi:acetyl esterase/lipase
MKRLALLVAVALTAPSRAGAQLPTPLPEISADAARNDRYPAHNAAFPNGVTSIADLQYWNPVGYRPLTLDLYLPPASVPPPATGFPLVIQIHGGAFMGGDKRLILPFVDWPGVLASLAARGYVVASINYRLSGEARFPAQAQDVKAAVRWLRLNAVKYAIDPGRAVTWGQSAGGHLASLAAVSCGAPALSPIGVALASGPREVTAATPSDCVQGAVAWFGLFDLATIQEQAREVKALSRDDADAPEWRLLGCFAAACPATKVTAASPVSYVDRNDPPMLLIVGSEDTLVPTRQTFEMAERLTAAGVKHELIVLPGINHSFIGSTAEATRDANLKALAATFEFIDRTIGNRSSTAR